MPMVSCLLIAMLSVAMAQLKFKQPVVKHELDPAANAVVIEFPFTATRDTTVVNYKSYCGCLSCLTTQQEWKEGEQGTIQLKLDATQVKQSISQSLEIIYQNAPSQTIKVDVILPPRISYSPKTLKWESDEAPVEKAFTITLHEGADFDLKAVLQTKDEFQLRLEPHQPEGESKERVYHLKVTPPAEHSSRLLNMITVQTTSKIKRYQSFKVLAMKQ